MPIESNESENIEMSRVVDNRDEYKVNNAKSIGRMRSPEYESSGKAVKRKIDNLPQFDEENVVD